jgi:hypothetical protein
MLGRSEIFRAAAIVALIACFVATLAAINRRPTAPAAEIPSTVTAPATDDLTAEDPHCVAVWEENRRRFFGRPARPLSPQTPPGAAASATPSKGDAR